MFAINHAATALLVKRNVPQTSMLWLLLSVQLMELLWVSLNHLRGEENHHRAGRQERQRYPSGLHSLLAFDSVRRGFAAAGYVIVRLLTNRPVLTMPVGTAVVSHLILDLITHAPNMPLAHGIDQPKLGLGLYGGDPCSAIVIENVYGAFCLNRRITASGGLLP